MVLPHQARMYAYRYGKCHTTKNPINVGLPECMKRRLAHGYAKDASDLLPVRWRTTCKRNVYSGVANGIS